MENKISRTINYLYNIIISNYQKLFCVIGIFCLLFSVLDINGESKSIEFLQNLMSQIGGIFISTSIISISFERWRDQKNHSEEKYYLMNSKILENGEELSKFNFFRFNDKGKILPIMNGEQLYTGIYRFENMLNSKIHLLKGQTVLVYGTKLKFLSKIEDIFYESVKSGVNYTFSLVNKQTVGITETDKIDIETSIQFIERQISKLKKLNNTKTGSIEVRYTPYFTPHSFSSFVYKNKRKVRTIDFNFRDSSNNQLIKYSQVFDTISSNIGDNELETLSDKLHEQYYDYYKKSNLAIKFPIPKEGIRIFVYGILENPIYGGIQGQLVLFEKEIPCICIKEYKYINTLIEDIYKKKTGYDIEFKEDISNAGAKDIYSFIYKISSGEKSGNVTLVDIDKWDFSKDKNFEYVNNEKINHYCNYYKIKSL